MNKFQKSFSALKQKQQLLGVLAFSFITILFWTAGSLISSQRGTTISPELLKLAEPLTPTIDEETLSRIERKRDYSAAELRGFTIYTTLSGKTGSQEQLVPLGTEIEPLSLTPSPEIISDPLSSTESGEIATSSGVVDPSDL